MRLFALAPAQITDERGELAVATTVTIRLDLRKQNLDGTARLFSAMGVALGHLVNLERLFECGVKFGQLTGPLGPAISRRRLLCRRSKPSAYRIAR